MDLNEKNENMSDDYLQALLFLCVLISYTGRSERGNPSESVKLSPIRGSRADNSDSTRERSEFKLERTDFRDEIRVEREEGEIEEVESLIDLDE